MLSFASTFKSISVLNLVFLFHLVDEEFSHPGTEALLCTGKFGKRNGEEKQRHIFIKEKKKKQTNTKTCLR